MAKDKDKPEGTVEEVIAAVVPTAAITAKPADEFGAFVQKYSGAILAGLPDSYGQDNDQKLQRFLRVLSTEVRRKPELLTEARRPSLLAAMCLSAQLGLEPGPTQRVYFIPYGSEVQFQLGWRGIAELAYRSGQLDLLTTRVVYTGDQFDWWEEDGVIRSIYRPSKVIIDPADRRLGQVYASVTYRNGQRDIEVMDRDQVDAIMRRSQASKAKQREDGYWYATSGPWSTDYEEMARKTVLKRLCKRVPMSEEDKRAIEQDEGVFKSIEPHMLDVPDTRDHGDVFAPIAEPSAPEAETTTPTGEAPTESPAAPGELVDVSVPQAAETIVCERRSEAQCNEHCFPIDCHDERGPVPKKA